MTFKKMTPLNSSYGLTSDFPNFNIWALDFSLKKRKAKTEDYKNSICPVTVLPYKEIKILLKNIKY